MEYFNFQCKIQLDLTVQELVDNRPHVGGADTLRGPAGGSGEMGLESSVRKELRRRPEELL